MKLIIGIPCRLQGRSTLFWECLEELDRPDGTDVLIRRNNSVAQARNEIAAEALRRGADAIWWLDDDLIFMPDTLMRALQRPESIVIGLSMMRMPVVPIMGDEMPTFRPLWSSRTHHGDKWQPVERITLEDNGLMRLVSGTGGGVLTRREVFEQVAPPWWAIGQFVPDMFWEDIYFYTKARAAGFDVWGDPNIRFGHDTMMTLWPHQREDGVWMTMLARGFEPMIATPWPEPRFPVVTVPSPERSWSGSTPPVTGLRIHPASVTDETVTVG
jgi:hypothetical protein